MKLVLAISRAAGGGAEHVLFQLANYFKSVFIDTEILITNQRSDEANLRGLNDNIPVTFLQDSINTRKIKNRVYFAACRMYETMHRSVPEFLAKHAFLELYGANIDAAISFLQKREYAVIVSFLQPTSAILMMARSMGVTNPLIVSERNDPARFFRTRYAPYLVKNYYPLLDRMVFQTPDAMRCYPECVQNKGSVILNPIRDSLPERYEGKRQKVIVNFCRLTAQKNLFLLLDAFAIFRQTHQDYKLVIFGNGEQEKDLRSYAESRSLTECFEIRPHRDDIHEVIRDYAMFVSSSDYEGMSNSMLEAMAIGLPVVCTDCPIGGAAYVIEDHENGLLVPLNDAQRMAAAMAEIADNEELAEKLSQNAAKLKQKMNIETIGQQWLQVIEAT